MTKNNDNEDNSIDNDDNENNDNNDTGTLDLPLASLCLRTISVWMRMITTTKTTTTTTKTTTMKTMASKTMTTKMTIKTLAPQKSEWSHFKILSAPHLYG